MLEQIDGREVSGAVHIPRPQAVGGSDPADDVKVIPETLTELPALRGYSDLAALRDAA